MQAEPKSQIRKSEFMVVDWWRHQQQETETKNEMIGVPTSINHMQCEAHCSKKHLYNTRAWRYLQLQATLSEAKQARKRASFHSHMEVSNNATSRKLLIFFSIWSIQKNASFFTQIRYPWWTGPARPGPALPGHNALWRVISQSSGKIRLKF